MFNSLRSWWIAILLALMVYIIVRVFIGQTFIIPSQSMENGLFQGDIVWVNKLSYGPRLPITLLTFPFAHKELSFSPGTNAFLEYLQMPYLRLSNKMEVKRNDVIAFNYPGDEFYPIDHRTHMVKRCIGLPGDVISIFKGVLHRNDTSIKLATTLKRNYLLINGKEDEIESYIDSAINLSEIQKMNEGLILNLTAEQLTFFQNLFHKRLVLFSAWQGHMNSSYYPSKIQIPKRGEVIQINTWNLETYRDILENHEGCEILKFPSGKFRMNHAEPTTSVEYKFKQDYYYVIGDNFDNSADSRNWGLLPESHILGKVTTIFYSIQSDGSFRWERTFKSIQ